MLEKLKVEKRKVEILEAMVEAHTSRLYNANRRLKETELATLNIMEDLHLKRQELEQNQKQLQAMQTQLIESAKMAAVGQLASGVAHEINNPLQAVELNLETMGLVLKEEDIQAGMGDLTELLKETKVAVRRCKEITEGLLNLSKPILPHKEEMDIVRPIEDALHLIQTQLNKMKIEVKKNLPPKGTRVLGDERELMQVFVNLITNAIRAMADSGERTLKITAITKGDKIILSFKDTGKGIPKKNLPHLFNPFFTTSYEDAGGEMKGTGLGLSICRNIIERHEGKIAIASRPGSGTTVSITLPVFGPDPKP